MKYLIYSFDYNQGNVVMDSILVVSVNVNERLRLYFMHHQPTWVHVQINMSSLPPVDEFIKLNGFLAGKNRENV